MMAPLICTPYVKPIVRDFEGTMHANVPLNLGPRWLDKFAYVSQFAWYTTWSLQRCRGQKARVGTGLLDSAAGSMSIA